MAFGMGEFQKPFEEIDPGDPLGKRSAKQLACPHNRLTIRKQHIAFYKRISQ